MMYLQELSMVQKGQQKDKQQNQGKQEPLSSFDLTSFSPFFFHL